MSQQQKKLYAAALAMLEKAYTPYSHFPVAASILAGNGEIYSGCNIENASFGLTLCAEASAIANMVTSGERRIKEVVVVAQSNDYCSPCGACRQRLVEFSTPETIIHFYNQTGEYKTLTMKELLPMPFLATTIEDV